MRTYIKKVAESVATEANPARDRSAGLVVFGTLDVLLGIFCFSLAMLLLIVVSSAGLHGLRPIYYWMAMSFLFYSTGWYIVLGLGSIKARRWARALLVVGAWVAVFFGTLALALVLYILPEAYGILADSGLIAPTVALGILYFAVFVLLFLQVVFPLIAVAFYGLESVRTTCERRNPEPSWTDRCPLPLLAMGFISTLGCLSIIAGATTHYTVFLFGSVVSGWPGMLVVAFLSIACGYVGWGAFTRKMHAWWGAYALVLLTCSSLMLTFAEIDMSLLYTHMGYSAMQIEQQKQFLTLSPASLTFISCVWGIMASIYLVWVRDCFRPEKDAVEVKSYQQRKTEEEAANPKPTTPRNRMRLD
ncbi:MAG: hypothetical protein KAU94_02485 [Verrucomicrobia bacterium]|nr:hypothetical protein [Verrucomicrobiota bacterium]